LLERLASVAARPSDDADERLRKSALVLLAGLLIPLTTVWVIVYAALGLWFTAAIPFTYQVLSLATLIVFLRTKRYELFRATQLTLMLFLPFLVQLSLGGFLSGSAVAMWAFASPLGALVFVGPVRAWPWYAGFAALLIASTILDFTVVTEVSVPQGVVITLFFLNIAGLSLVTYLMLQYFVRERELAMGALQIERAKSERLLLNVLPESIAERLKERQEVIADAFPEVSVLFADIVGFTPQAERVSPDRTVGMLNDLFSEFDRLAEERGLEKIKTIGDAYMVAGGLPDPAPGHAEAMAEMALDMMEVAGSRTLSDDEPVRLRIGIDSGPVVAGVIGRRKFIYDLWGDTVNTASRMESHGVPGCIQVTERTRALLGDRYSFSEQRRVPVKGKGDMATYFLTGRVGDQ
jgi:adenylate cyclase